jgi:hypothetical protein
MGFEKVLSGKLRRGPYSGGVNKVISKKRVFINHFANLAAGGMKKLDNFIDRVCSETTAWMPGCICEPGSKFVNLAIVYEQCATAVLIFCPDDLRRRHDS